MALTNGPGLGLLVNGTSGEEHYDELMLRWRWLDSIIQAKALDHDLTAPPGSPSDGDTYIVGAAATGAWATHDGKLARYNGLASAWEFLAPKAGWWVWVVSESWYFVFNGSAWVAFDAGGIPDAPSDGSLYGRKDAGWEQVPAGLADAPSDGKLYGREDATWVEIPAPAAVEQVIPIACSDETTPLTAGAAKVTFRMPFAFTLTEVRASVTTAPTGSVLTVDINEAGASILSTPITIDAGAKTSTTATTPAVISDAALADDAEITIDIDGVGSIVAGAGLKVYLIGVAG